MSEQNQNPKSPVRHSDFLRRVPYSPVQFQAASLRSIENIAEDPEKPDDLSIELGMRVASLTLSDRSQRTSHHIRYRHMLQIPEEVDIVPPGIDGSAEESLIAFHKQLRVQGVTNTDSIWREVGKGISAELGHVDQRGHWESAKPLDDEMRSLPYSPKLRAAGFVFEDTYGQKDSAKIDYSFKLVNNEQGKHANRVSKTASIMAIRKRAAADIHAEDGSRYEIIKRSSFLLDVLRLPENQQPFLADIFGVLRKDDDFIEGEKEVAERRAHQAGDAIIEPYLADKQLRERSKVVLAVSSLYFALKRY